MMIVVVVEKKDELETKKKKFKLIIFFLPLPLDQGQTHFIVNFYTTANTPT